MSFIVSFCEFAGMQYDKTNQTWCERAIILMRNPYEAILSEYNRQYGYSHTQTAKVFGESKSFLMQHRPTVKVSLSSYRTDLNWIFIDTAQIYGES